jgi:hypothetical protein
VSSNSGDIVDTATYLRYHGHGFSIKYVEGWTIQQATSGVVIADKDSSETVAIHAGEYLPRSKLVKADLAKLSATLPKFRRVFLRSTSLPAGQAFRAQYHTLSAKDPVTGKQVPVVVDRYYLPSSSRWVTVTLSTPIGVDNVDAFRLIARSYRWK